MAGKKSKEEVAPGQQELTGTPKASATAQPEDQSAAPAPQGQAAKVAAAGQTLVTQGPKPLSKADEMFEGYSPEEIEKLTATTGMEDIPESERRPPLYTFNLDMVDDSGNDIKPDRLYNCKSGEQFDHIMVALLAVKRSREYAYYNKETHQKIMKCRSYDLEVGVMQETGELCDCNKCRF